MSRANKFFPSGIFNTSTLGRNNLAAAWRDGDDLYAVRSSNGRDTRIFCFDWDSVERRSGKEIFSLPSDRILRGLWMDDEYAYLVDASNRKVVAFSRTTGREVRAVGAAFLGAGDFQLRDGGVVNPRDLWGNASTMWVLNNNIQNLEFTGDRTKLVAFNRANGSYDADKDIDIQDVIATGQGVCGNSTHLWVLADGWLRCWTHAGARTSSRDIRVADGVETCFFDGQYWWAGQVAYDSAGNVASDATPTYPPLLPGSVDRDYVGAIGSSDIRAVAVNFPRVAASRYAPVPGSARFRCTETYTITGEVVHRISRQAYQRGALSALWTAVGDPIVTERVDGEYRVEWTDERAASEELSGRSLSGRVTLPNEYTAFTTTEGMQVSFQELTFESRQIAFTNIISGTETRETHSVTGSGMVAVECELISLATRQWQPTSQRSLLDESFSDAVGAFLDGNDLWVIEPNILVAAKFTIQDDGTIVRNLS